VSAPDPLRRAVARDLRPVRPLLPPFRRALILLPVALLTVAAVPLLHFFRSDMSALGWLGSWGLSFAEAVGGVLVVALALRESIPGRWLPGAAVAATLIAGLLLPYAVLAATARNFAIGAPPGAEWSDGLACFRTSAGAAIPALLASAVLAFRALPVRPGIAGALYGLGSALIGDAGLRLFCEFTVPSHVIGAHGGAILAVVVVGIVVSKCTTSYDSAMNG
jgi:negative regulator of sigma F NrsF-like protein